MFYILFNITKLWLIIFIFLFTMNTLLSKKKLNMEKGSTFECGFDPNHKTRSSFSLRFFTITVIFLIFDAEVTAIFPLPMASNSTKYLNFFFLNMFFIALLVGGLFYEWTQGMLTWN